jgi:glyoxylase-like metal-dependent hydrolase (beta-lactamase superfamily II)
VTVLVAGFPAEAFGTNCYVVAPAPGERCVVVDPGIGVVERLDALLEEHRLHPAAVLLTHGHLDHAFSVTPVCGARDIPAYVHPGDYEILADPVKGLSPEFAGLLGVLRYTEPDDVRPLPNGGTIEVAGLAVTVDHAPGHTGGSVLFRLPGGFVLNGQQVDSDQLCLSGDVLFAGSIGRTDLPGGDPAAMVASLRDKVLPLADSTVVLPGHGPVTTIGRERASNPYLLEIVDGTTQAAGPTRGW